jgi:hypothetical protein
MCQTKKSESYFLAETQKQVIHIRITHRFYYRIQYFIYFRSVMIFLLKKFDDLLQTPDKLSH